MGCWIPTWAETVGDCIANNVILKRYCAECQHAPRTSLDELLAEHGPDYWLWDRRTPCPKCNRPLVYLFTPGKSTPTTPMISTVPVDVRRSERMRQMAARVEDARPEP